MGTGRGSWWIVVSACAAGFVVGWLVHAATVDSDPSDVTVEPLPVSGPAAADDTAPEIALPRGRPRAMPAESDPAPPVSPSGRTHALGGAELLRLAALLRTTNDPAEASRLARTLVLRGGHEGIDVVAEVARGDPRGMEFRTLAIEALALAPPPSHAHAAGALFRILGTSLPVELEPTVAHAIARLEGRGAVASLVQALREGDVNARVALEAMRHLVVPGDVPLLLELLAETSGGEAERAVLRTLGYAAGSGRVAMILEMLASPPEGVRRTSLGWALGQFARRDDLDELHAALADEEHPAVQSQILRAITRAGGQQALAEVVASFRNAGHPLDGTLLVHALCDTASPQSVPLMAEVLADVHTPEAAGRLARAMARTGGEAGREHLLALIADGSAPASRMAAAGALEAFGRPEDAKRLAELFASEEDRTVSVRLAQAVLALDPAVGQEQILARLDGFENPRQRAAIAEVLERRGTGALAPVRDALRRESDARTQWQLARALAVRGPAGLRALEAALADDPDAQRRQQILRGATSVDARHAAALAPGLLTSDPAPEVRASAAHAMSRSKSQDAEAVLTRALRTERDPRVREAIEEALAGL